MNKQTALVIGGSRGIGRAIALRLAQSDFNIVITYRNNTNAAMQTRNEIEKKGVNCELMQFDITDREECKKQLNSRFEENPPDAVIYNAGISADNLLVWMTDNEWDSVIKTNLDGFYNTIKPLVFPMIAAKKGRIIIITSTSGQIGQAGQVNYSASKAGLIGATKALAREVGRKGIFVNAVAPGVIETDMTKDLPKDRVLPLIPLKKYGKPEDVAAVVNFLCSEENMYIHGQIIGVNGGLAI